MKKPKMENPNKALISLCMVSFIAGAIGFMLFSHTPPLATILCTVSFIYALRAFVFSIGAMRLKKTSRWKELAVLDEFTLGIVCVVSGILTVCGLAFLFLIASGMR